jgi:hypothetical protein
MGLDNGTTQLLLELFIAAFGSITRQGFLQSFEFGLNGAIKALLLTRREGGILAGQVDAISTFVETLALRRLGGSAKEVNCCNQQQPDNQKNDPKLGRIHEEPLQWVISAR